MTAATHSGAPPPTVLDVRPHSQFSLMHLPNALHIPFEELDKRVGEVKELLSASGVPQDAGSKESGDDTSSRLYVLCRRGNNSQLAVARLRDLGVSNAVDVVGGIENWAKCVDDSMPII